MKIAIVLGGGSGQRAGGPVPKQFQTLDRQPVLMHSIRAMSDNGADMVYAVIHPDYLDHWDRILRQQPFKAIAVAGGRTRWHSVSNALKRLVSEDFFTEVSLIAVHDGARPLATPGMIHDAWQAAAIHGSAVPAIPLSDSIRVLMPDGHYAAADRNMFRAVQTPQVFKADLLIKAYSAPFSEKFTDDASVVEEYGAEIFLTHGDPRNIKITHPGDMDYARTLLSRNSSR